MESDKGIALRLDAWKDVRRILAGGSRGGRVVVVMRRAEVGAMECHFLMGAFRRRNWQKRMEAAVGVREAKSFQSLNEI